MERERVAVVMWCEKLRISQLMSHFAKLSAGFGVFFFCLIHQKNIAEKKKKKTLKKRP